MLDKLEKNSFPTMAYVDTINSQYDYDNAKFSPPVVQSYNEKISGYFQRAIEGVDGTAVIKQNVLNQLKAASDSIIAASEIDDNGVVTSIAPAEDFEQAREWIDKIDEELTRALQNITKIASFLNETDTSNVTPWAYEDSQEINITCPGLEELKNLKDEMLGDLEGVPDIDGEFHQTDFLDPDQVEENIQIDPCYNAGLESMAWILCPTLNNSKNAVSLIDSLIEDWLSVSTNIYSMQDEDNNLTGAYIAWSYIRGIANVAMIIILLFIIFSQLTGYGIDNYGIKKMLPKLIIVAILINLSFLICELVIDLSNIVGSGINQIFRTIGKDIIGTGSESLIEGFVGHVITILFAAVGVVGAVAPVAISVIGVAGSEGGGVMIVILIVLALLVVLAAILLFFIMLGARMVIIILCTALSPLAFVCYVMPNTQGIYKKWWNLFKGALIMFPICGAIGGIGYMVKAIVLTTSGVHLWMMVFAIIVPYLPMFLLPSLLKGAIAGLGKVGATLSTLGNQFRNGAKGVGDAVQNTDRYKDRLQFAKDSAAAARAQRVHDRLSGRTGLTRSQQDRLRRADDVILAQRKRERENALRTDGAGYFNAMSTKQDVELAGETAAVERYNDQGYRAAAEASIASKAVAAATSDQEALLTNGRAALNTGGFVNTNDAGSVGQYHREALARYRAATTEAERSTAMAQVRAAQNILSKTDKGRAEVAGNLATALRNGETAGLQDAASHLMSEYGDKYKSVNRGSHAMISDLSTTMDFNANLAGLQAKLDQIDANGDVIQSGAYSMAGTNKYTAESLVGADDSALDSFITSIQNNSLTGDSLTDLQSTAYKALDMKRTGTLSIKPEVEKKLQQIVGNFVPQDIAAQQAVQQAAAQAAQQQFDSITRNLDEINQQLHQHGNPQNGPQGGPDTFDGGAGI